MVRDRPRRFNHKTHVDEKMIDISDIAFLPIDLPPIPRKDKVLNNFVKELNYGWWDAIRLFEPTINFEPTDKWAEHINTHLPELKEWIIENIPYTAHIHGKIMKSRDQVYPHVDYQDPNRRPDVFEHLRINEPSSYRLFFTGNRKHGVYVCKSKDSLPEHRIYPELPEGTDVYAMPYTNQVHGVDFETDRVIAITNGYIDIPRHHALLQKSFKKYEKFLVRRSDLL